MSTVPIQWNRIEGIVLDAVGTLIEPMPSVAQAYVDAAHRQGCLFELSEVKRRFQRFFRVDEVDEQLGPLATDEATEYRRWQRIVANVLPDLPDPERAFNELWIHFGRSDAWQAFDDVEPAIIALTESEMSFVIASNFDGRLRTVLAGLPALASCQSKVVISSEIGYRKPHPAFYRAACDRMGLSLDRVLCVGDDVENDVAGPERAGLHGLLLDRTCRNQTEITPQTDLTIVVRTLLQSRVSDSGGSVP